MTVEDIVGGSDPADPDGETPGDLRVKPALRTLLIDQAKLLDPDMGDEHALRSGFPSRRAVIEWYQRAVVRTMGNISDGWAPLDCFTNTQMLGALIREDEGTCVEPADEVDARVERVQLESMVVQPACTAAYQDIRDKAVEYIKSESDDASEWAPRELDPSNQSSIAMRPGFQSLDEQQADVLDELWDGFDDVDDLLDWLHALNAPSNGEVDDDISKKITVDKTAMGYLIDAEDDPEARVWREWFACHTVLPAFVEGVRSMETSELAQVSSDGAVTLRDE